VADTTVMALPLSSVMVRLDTPGSGATSQRRVYLNALVENQKTCRKPWNFTMHLFEVSCEYFKNIFKVSGVKFCV
jgi:hypothetical protein